MIQAVASSSVDTFYLSAVKYILPTLKPQVIQLESCRQTTLPLFCLVLNKAQPS